MVKSNRHLEVCPFLIPNFEAHSVQPGTAITFQTGSLPLPEISLLIHSHSIISHTGLFHHYSWQNVVQ